MADTDAAGVIYFSRQFALAHEAFERFLETVGLGLGRIVREEDFRVPIVHAESDYKAPLRLGDPVTVNLIAEKIGNTSFALCYDLLDHAGRNVGRVRTVHVAVDARTWKKRPVPDKLRHVLENLLAVSK